MPHSNYNEVAIIDIVKLFNVRTSAQAAKWLNDNQMYQVIMYPYPTSTLSAYNISVLTGLGQLDWLKEASDFIDYASNYKYIEELHLIHNSNAFIGLIDGAITNGDYISYTMDQILTNLTIPDYDQYNYDKYISIKFDFVNKTAGFTLQDNNQLMTDFCFSFPFFRSMIKNKKITDLSKCTLSFVTISLRDGDTVMFRLDYKNGPNTALDYYDYSHNPPLRMGGTFMESSHAMQDLFKSHKIYF